MAELANHRLARQVLDVADHDPGHFDMSTWGRREVNECGTVACLAGHVLLRSGYKLRDDFGYDRPDGTRVNDIPQEAEELLGVTGRQPYSALWLLGVTGRQQYSALWLWYDSSGGVAAFREMTERAEKRAAEAGEL